MALACSSEAPAPAASLLGQGLFDDPAFSASSTNRYSCRTCHDTSVPTSAGSAASRRKPGAHLAGVTLRPAFWNGQENDLRSAINACLYYFMGANHELAPEEERARALYAYLESLEPGNPNLVPFTLIRNVEDVARGDARLGEQLYTQACAPCHGSREFGVGRLTDKAPLLPQQTIAEHADYTPRLQRLVFIEKTRHGGFFGYGGSMPPFSKEALSDSELGAILEYLAVLGQ